MNKKSLIILSIFVLGMLAPMVRAATTYEFPLAEGTGESTVKVYDEDMWEDTLGKDVDPTDIFGGDADVVDAKAKSTIKEWEETDYDVWDLAGELNPDWKDLWLVMSGVDWDDIEGLAGQTGEEIIENGYSEFPDGEWAVWEVTRDKWDFVDGAYDADPDEEDDTFPIFQDPEDAEDLLDAANGFMKSLTYLGAILGGAGDAMAEAGAAAAGDSYDGDAICWSMFVELGLPMAKPVAEYTTAVIDGLDPDNWEFTESSKLLVGAIEGAEDDYNVRVTLSDMGVATKIEFVNMDAEAFYTIEGAAQIPGYEIPVMLAVAAFSTIGLVYLIMKKRK
jgi:hypothetical protein